MPRYTPTDSAYAAMRIESDLQNGIALDERRVTFYRIAAVEAKRVAERLGMTPCQIDAAGRGDELVAETIRARMNISRAA